MSSSMLSIKYTSSYIHPPPRALSSPRPLLRKCSDLLHFRAKHTLTLLSSLKYGFYIDWRDKAKISEEHEHYTVPRGMLISHPPTNAISLLIFTSVGSRHLLYLPRKAIQLPLFPLSTELLKDLSPLLSSLVERVSHRSLNISGVRPTIASLNQVFYSGYLKIIALII